MTLQFRPATRKRTPIKIAVMGPSGSGKTHSSLELATGLGSKIAFIDTENGSASLYSSLFKFDVIDLSPPFDVKKYLEAIKIAEDSDYEVLIIDSLSHAWAGEGGLLEKKSALDQRGGNSYTNWGQITPEHEKLKSAILQSPMHVIVCMRSKQAVVLRENEKGKMIPVKVGMEAVQREGIEYEFSVVFEIDMDHAFKATKDRTRLFDGRSERMQKSHGEEIKRYLDDAPAVISKAQKLALQKIMLVMKWNPEEMSKWVQEHGYSQATEILAEDFETLRNELEEMQKAFYSEASGSNIY